MIISATVWTGGNGADKVFLETNLPSATHPFKGTEALKFEAAKGSAVEYIRKHFPGIIIKVIGPSHPDEPAKVIGPSDPI